MLERLILSLIFHCSLQTVPPSSVETLAGTGSFTHPANQLKPSRLPDLGLPEHCCTGRPSPPFQPIFMSPLWHRNYWLQHFQSHLSCHTDAPPTALPRHTRRSICLFFFLLSPPSFLSIARLAAISFSDFIGFYAWAAAGGRIPWSKSIHLNKLKHEMQQRYEECRPPKCCRFTLHPNSLLDLFFLLFLIIWNKAVVFKQFVHASGKYF